MGCFRLLTAWRAFLFLTWMTTHKLSEAPCKPDDGQRMLQILPSHTGVRYLARGTQGRQIYATL